MRLPFVTPKTICTISSVAAVMLAALVAGCDSGPNMSSPETKKDLETRQQVVSEQDKKAADMLNKKGKGAVGGMKSIKGGVKAPGSE